MKFRFSIVKENNERFVPTDAAPAAAAETPLFP